MRRASPLQALAASPTMVGAVTTLIVIVAVFLAYNANNGLPFVPVYRVSVVVPQSPRLLKNNEVRIGGHRVGVVESIDPIHVKPSEVANVSEASEVVGNPSPQNSASDTCCVAAKLNLKLDQSASPLPKDSIFRVRYRSTFGLKFLEVTRGTGPDAPEGFVFDGVDDTGTCDLPLDPKTFASTEPASSRNGCFQPQTEFDAIADTFDTKTRTNARTNLIGFGDAFAGRGASLNDAIGTLRPLFGNLEPVSEVLSDPSTRLRGFFEALGRTARIVAPVAVEQADLFRQAEIALGAISADPQALQATISEGAALVTEGPAELRRQRPFLAEFAELSRRLRPGVRQLRIAIPTLNDAITIGTPVLNRDVQANNDLRGVLVELKNTVEQPSTKTSLQRLKDTFDTAKPLLTTFTPYQTVCDDWNYSFYDLWEHISQRDAIGFTERVDPVVFPANQEGSPGGYSGIQANGKTLLDGDLAKPGVQHVFDPNSLAIRHDDPYDPAVDSRGRADCQAGQGGYPLGQALAPGQQPSNPAWERNNPILSGPTFAGRSREP